MAGRFSANKLTAAALSATLVLAGCAAPPAPEAAKQETAQDPEARLRTLSAAMQKTVLEGALAGAAAGTAIGMRIGTGTNRNRNRNIGFAIGLGAGAAAGSYVAYLQKEYATKEDRLERLRADLDKNNAEIATTLNVMREVLAVQRAELDALRAKVAAGTADRAALEAEVADASANLAEMQKAIDGAAGRQAEFAETRGLELVDESGEGAEAELDLLARRVAAMRAVAADLAAQL